MDSATRREYDAGRGISGQPIASACYAPFVSLLLDPRGFVRSCCQDWTHALGNITRERLPDIWRGERFAALRRDLAAYELPSGCANCQWHIDRGDHAGAYARVFDGVPMRSAAPEWPRAMEFMLSNSCNLECVQCLGELSSSIRRHRDGLPPLPHVYDDRFMEDLRPFLRHLDHATFMGGEPFLSPENFRIWDMMIEENTRFLCIVSTNGTVRNDRVERILDELPCMLVVSLDGATRATVESIRRNARFDEVMANVRHFRARARDAASAGPLMRQALGGLARGMRVRDVAAAARRGVVTRLRGRALFGLSFCLMPQNHHEFGDFLALAEDLGCEAFVNTVYHPQRFSMTSLSREALSDVVRDWERRDASVRARLRMHLPAWDEQLSHLRNQLERGLPAPRNLFLATLGRRAVGSGRPGAAREAREELLAWSGNGRVDEVSLDADDIVSSAPSGIGGLEPGQVAGRSLTEVLLRLRERYGGEVEVQDEAHAAGSARRLEFRDLDGAVTALRWIAIAHDGSPGAAPKTTLVAAMRPADARPPGPASACV